MRPRGRRATSRTGGAPERIGVRRDGGGHAGRRAPSRSLGPIRTEVRPGRSRGSTMTVGTETVSLAVGRDDVLAAIRARARGIEPARCSPTCWAARRVYGDRLIAVCWLDTRYVLDRKSTRL